LDQSLLNSQRTLEVATMDDTGSPRRRFDRVAITSVFGPPDDPRTWSGAPFHLGVALAQLGIDVVYIHPEIGCVSRLALAMKHLLKRHGRISSSEQVLRGAAARKRMALIVARTAAQLGLRHVLHTGTLDLPALDLRPGIRHYLYCDQTWDLSLRHRPDRDDYRAGALEEFERLERQALSGLEHAFTFAQCVGDNLVEHYGLPPERVSAVGSGMGDIRPYHGPKSYDPPRLLFVAKHLFAAKGGPLALEAFALARRQRPDLSLTVVADPSAGRIAGRFRGVAFRSRVPQAELQALYRDSTLLLQPMLNDPWGQVYLEALASRTPVLGLDRNGLPEIAGGGRYGFRVSRAEPGAIAEAILDAVSDLERLARMGRAGQMHVLREYSWDRVAARIGYLTDERSDRHAA
jgi:glycosyltransferase involved in cell wall biosynthesis